MFKTIKSKTLLIQTISMIVMVGIVFVLFVTSFDDYYFSRKLNVIEKAYNYLAESDLETIKYADKVLVRYRDQNIKFLIANENFNSIFADEKIFSSMRTENSTEKETQKDMTDIQDSHTYIASVHAKIERYIKQNVDNFKDELTLKNKKHRICGYGIMTQNGHKYYVYIYETKAKMKIGFSYNKIFLLLTGLLAVVVGVFISVWLSNKISKPIKQIESAAREAIDNNFDVHITENQEFQEISSLAKSINIMLAHIREQMQTLEEEIAHKTAVEEKRQQFVHNVSHEMKTPLAIISSQVEMLELIKDEKQKREYCRSIIEETTNMSDMINDMIVVYAAQSDSEAMALEKADVSQIVEDTCVQYEDLFAKNKMHLHQSYEDDCRARVNKRYLAQAVDNYITNSVKHCVEHGNVYVRVMKNNDYIRIEVENEGPQIPEKYKDKIWDMFFKGDVSETLNGQKGSGVGLYLVKSIVELHRGNYGFENLEKGIVFWIEIPRI